MRVVCLHPTKTRLMYDSVLSTNSKSTAFKINPSKLETFQPTGKQEGKQLPEVPETDQIHRAPPPSPPESIKAESPSALAKPSCKEDRHQPSFPGRSSKPPLPARGLEQPSHLERTLSNLICLWTVVCSRVPDFVSGHLCWHGLW